MNPSTAKSAAIITGILAVYFTLAALALGSDETTTPADDAATHVVGIIAGGLALLAVLFAFEQLIERRPAQPPEADEHVDDWR
jgi:hypothetical protein